MNRKQRREFEQYVAKTQAAQRERDAGTKPVAVVTNSGLIAVNDELRAKTTTSSDTTTAEALREVNRVLYAEYLEECERFNQKTAQKAASMKLATAFEKAFADKIKDVDPRTGRRKGKFVAKPIAMIALAVHQAAE